MPKTDQLTSEIEQLHDDLLKAWTGKAQFKPLFVKMVLSFVKEKMCESGAKCG